MPPVAADAEADQRVTPNVVTQLANSTASLRGDRDAALVSFRLAVARAARSWPEMTEARQRLTEAAVVEFVYRASPWPDLSRAAIEAVAQRLGPLRDGGGGDGLDADRLAAAAWAAGVLTRLSRENDLPAYALRPARRALALAFESAAIAPELDGDAFTDGARLALRSAAPVIAAQDAASQPPELWRRYIELVRAMFQESLPRDRALVAALESLLKIGPSAVRSNSVLEAIGAMVSELSWDAESAARMWLIERFDDPSFSNEAMWAVTSELVRSQPDAGVDITMTLRVGADPLARATLRDQYRGVWGLIDVGETDEFIADWAATARASLEHQPEPDSASRLTHTVSLAQLSAAARLLLVGRFEAAVATTEAVIEQEPPERDDRSLSLREVSGDGDWALSYLSAERDTPRRQRLIQQLGRRRNLGSVDAEVLVAEAVRGSPRKVRQDAAELVVRFIDSPAVVNAFLEELPLMPATRVNADLIARVTLTPRMSPRRAQWRLEARRALVERLLEQLAGAGAWSSIDGASRRLARVYAHRAGLAFSLERAETEAPIEANEPAAEPSESGLDRAEGDEPSVPAPLQAGEFLRSRWMDEARRSHAPPNELDAAVRFRASRLIQSSGPIQRFHTEQLAIVDLMASVVRAERPNASGGVRDTLDALREERSVAVDITEQLLAAERAMLRLWVLRLTGDLP
ncbi:MAG: hypothetical protein AAGK04_10530 [Planctomycetota bacterium]